MSVAAVALPTAIAYAELIGFEPVVGLYAAILPMLVYAIFGTYREPGRCHLCHRRHNFDAAGGGSLEFADGAFDSIGSIHGDPLPSGRFPAAGLRGEFSKRVNDAPNLKCINRNKPILLTIKFAPKTFASSLEIYILTSKRLGSFVHIGGLLDVNSTKHGKNECLQ